MSHHQLIQVVRHVKENLQGPRVYRKPSTTAERIAHEAAEHVEQP